MLGFTRIVVSLGSISLAAHAVAKTAEMVSYLPGMAFQIATITLAGQFLGKGKHDIAELSVKRTDMLARIFMRSFGVLFIIIPEMFVKSFTTDKEVIQLASTVLRIEGFSQIFLARFYVYGGLLRGIGAFIIMAKTKKGKWKRELLNQGKISVNMTEYGE